MYSVSFDSASKSYVKKFPKSSECLSKFIRKSVIDPFKNAGTKYEASKIRKLLNQVFNFAVTEAYLEPELMPYGLDKQLTWETGIISKPHPHLAWKDFRDQLITKLSSNSSNSGRLANLALKAFAELSKHVSTVLKIPNGPKAKKLAGLVKRDTAELHPNLDSVSVMKKAIEHFNSKVDHYKEKLE